MRINSISDEKSHMMAFITYCYRLLPIVYKSLLIIKIMNTQTPQIQSGNVYSIYKQNVQKYFENVSKNIPQYFQSLTHLQEEYVKACEKTMDASISVQQEFAKKNRFTTEIPDSLKTTFVDISKQVVQTNIAQNQIAKTTIDSTVQNIKTFNENVHAFTDLNKSIIQSWIASFTQLKN